MLITVQKFLYCSFLCIVLGSCVLETRVHVSLYSYVAYTRVKSCHSMAVQVQSDGGSRSIKSSAVRSIEHQINRYVSILSVIIFIDCDTRYGCFSSCRSMLVSATVDRFLYVYDALRCVAMKL